MYALAHRREATPRWGFMLFSGVTDLILSGIIFWGFPGTAPWMVGLIVGINMVFGEPPSSPWRLQAVAVQRSIDRISPARRGSRPYAYSASEV